MSRGLQHYPEPARMNIAMRRTKVKTNGLGYWGAVAFLNKKGIKTKEQHLADAVANLMHDANIQVNNFKKREDRNGAIKHRRVVQQRPGLSFDRNTRTKLSKMRKTVAR